MGYDADQRFDREIKEARDRFEKVEHANYPPWSDTISNPISRFVIVDEGIDAHVYINSRDGIEFDGMGVIDGRSVHVARVI